MWSAGLGRGTRVAFADRHDGVSLPPYDRGNLGDHVGDDPAAVAGNRAALAAALGVKPQRLQAMSPTHGREVAVITDPQPTSVPAVDALVTCTPGIALLVLAADCVPVLLGDGEAGVVGAVHSGWRGVLADVLGAALGTMQDLGAHPDRMRAVIGPAICGSCYPVDTARYAAVVARAPAAASVSADGSRALDLRAAVVERLRLAGVRTVLHGSCTREGDQWFSYRRDGVTGRHGGAVLLTGDPR